MRMAIRHFDTHTKKEYDLEKKVLTMGEIDNGDEQEMGKDPSLQMKEQLLQTKTVLLQFDAVDDVWCFYIRVQHSKMIRLLGNECTEQQAPE